MKILKQFGIILIFLYLGELANLFFNLPIPDTVFGMIFLYISLLLGIVKIKDIEDTANYLVDLISLFLIPPALAIMDTYGQIKNDIFVILLIIVISTIVTLVVTGKIVCYLQRRINNVK